MDTKFLYVLTVRTSKIMTSLTFLLIEYQTHNPKKKPKDFCKAYPDYNKDSVMTMWYRVRNKNFKKVQNVQDIDIRTELIKIVKDKKEPGSTKVSAMRFYKELVETTPIVGDDPLLKLYNTILEKRTSENQT